VSTLGEHYFGHWRLVRDDDMHAPPTIGRVVHYQSHGSADGKFASLCRAAIITEVPHRWPDSYDRYNDIPNGTDGVWIVHLLVLNPGGMWHDQDVRLDPGRGRGTWHWPERLLQVAAPVPN
jgi:hypothetical protein